jgi:hypothetical protein
VLKASVIPTARSPEAVEVRIVASMSDALRASISTSPES